MRSSIVNRLLLPTTATSTSTLKSSSTTTASRRSAPRGRPHTLTSSMCVPCRCVRQLPPQVPQRDNVHHTTNPNSWSLAPIVSMSSISSSSAAPFPPEWQRRFRRGDSASAFSTVAVASTKGDASVVERTSTTTSQQPGCGERPQSMDRFYRPERPNHATCSLYPFPNDNRLNNNSAGPKHFATRDLQTRRLGSCKNALLLLLFSSSSQSCLFSTSSSSSSAGLDGLEHSTTNRNPNNDGAMGKKQTMSLEQWWLETERLLQLCQPRHNKNDIISAASSETYQRPGSDFGRRDPNTIRLEQMVEAIRCGTRFRTPETLRRCWELWDILLESVPISSMPWPYRHGNHPQLTHVLNALVDSWRIVWEQQLVLVLRNEHDPKSRGRTERNNDAAKPRLEQTTTRDASKIASREDGERDTSSANTTTRVLVVESPLELMHLLQQHPTSQWMDRRTCTVLLSALGHYPLQYRHERHDAPLYCEGLLSYMVMDRTLDDVAPSEAAEDGGNKDERRTSETMPSTSSKLWPDTVAWTSVLQAWARSGRNDASQRALELWGHWQEWVHQHDGFSHDGVDFEPNLISYNTLLDVLCSSQQFKWLQVAEELLLQMMQEQHCGDSPHLHLPCHWPSPPPAPNHVSFQLMIQGYVRSGLLSKTLPWLQRMVECHQGHVDIFSNVLSAAVKKRQFDLAEEVYHLYQAAATAASTLDISSDTRSTGTLMSPQHQALHNLAPSPYLSRALLIWYAQTQRPEQAELELNRLELWPDGGHATGYATFGHYGDVLQAWATHSSANLYEVADHCERILGRMIRVAQQRNQERWTEERLVNVVLGLWAKAATNTGVSHSALARSNASRSESEGGDRKRPEERAEELLRYLRTQSGVPIGASSYHKVMQAYVNSNHPDAARRVTELLHELERDPVQQPTRFHYTAAIQAWMRHANADRATVEAQLEQIIEASLTQVREGNSDAQPDATLLGTMLHAFARLGNGPSAERVLNLLCQMSGNQGKGRFAPTVREMNLVLLSWLRSNDSAALRKARSVVIRMKQERGIQSNERTRHLLKDLHSRYHKSSSRKLV